MPRDQERVPFLVEVMLNIASARCQARISDLSSGGCFIDSIVSVTPGDAIDFDLKHPSGDSMHFKGEITYAMPAIGFGVKFLDISESQKLFTERIVKT
ncbi:MAG: PilZ domain-containing protein, partial [Acidobacteriota bacterium]